MARDPHFERLFFEELSAYAQRGGYDIAPFIEAVKDRLSLGADRYGDNDFLSKDVLRELLEETPDVTAYVLLRFQSLAVDGTEDALAQAIKTELFKTALYSAQADYHARLARHLEQEGCPAKSSSAALS